MTTDIDQEIAADLEEFLERYQGTVRRVTYCRRGHEPVNAARGAAFPDPSSSQALDHEQTWRNVEAFALGATGALMIPSTGAGVVLIRVDDAGSLVLDCPIKGRIGVVVTLGQQLAERLRSRHAAGSEAEPR